MYFSFGCSLSVPCVHGFVVVLEVNPAAKAGYGFLPFTSVSLNDSTAFVVVCFHALYVLNWLVVRILDC